MPPVPHAVPVTSVLAALGAGFAAATPAPEPAPTTGPGLVGFLVTIALVAACIPLFRSMAGKVRGVQYRDRSGDGPGAGEVPGAGDGPGAADRGTDERGPSGP